VSLIYESCLGLQALTNSSYKIFQKYDNIKFKSLKNYVLSK